MEYLLIFNSIAGGVVFKHEILLIDIPSLRSSDDTIMVNVARCDKLSRKRAILDCAQAGCMIDGNAGDTADTVYVRRITVFKCCVLFNSGICYAIINGIAIVTDPHNSS